MGGGSSGYTHSLPGASLAEGKFLARIEGPYWHMCPDDALTAPNGCGAARPTSDPCVSLSCRSLRAGMTCWWGRTEPTAQCGRPWWWVAWERAAGVMESWPTHRGRQQQSRSGWKGLILVLSLSARPHEHRTAPHSPVHGRDTGSHNVHKPYRALMPWISSNRSRTCLHDAQMHRGRVWWCEASGLQACSQSCIVAAADLVHPCTPNASACLAPPSPPRPVPVPPPPQAQLPGFQARTLYASAVQYKTFHGLPTHGSDWELVPGVAQHRARQHLYWWAGQAWLTP